MSEEKCLNKSTNHANARIPAIATGTAMPARSTTAKMAQEPTAGKTVNRRRKTIGRLKLKFVKLRA